MTRKARRDCSSGQWSVGHDARLAWLGSLQDEHNRNHGEADIAHDAEIIDERKHHGLLLDHAVEQSLCLMKSLYRAGTGSDETLCQSVHLVLETGRLRGDVPGENKLMFLRAAIEQGS